MVKLVSLFKCRLLMEEIVEYTERCCSDRPADRWKDVEIFRFCVFSNLLVVL